YGYGGYGYGGYGGYGYPAYSYYSYPSYSVYPSYGYSYYPCSTIVTTPTALPPTSLSYSLTPSVAPSLSTVPPKPGIQSPTLPPPMPRADGTYSYDGGPMTPVPMPRGEESMTLPRVPTPILDRVVSLPIGPT